VSSGGGSRLDIVTIDSADTKSLALFWCDVLDANVSEFEDDGRWICLVDGSGRRVLGIQRTTQESSDARAHSRVHLDLACAPASFAAERARILALGATETRAPREEPYGSIANLADPDGNLFDLCAYTPGAGGAAV
jgi:predicted enzyme related to lactoylglutathione lyase